MKKVNTQATIQLQMTLVLNETEARALDALAGYGFADFIKVFYTYLGEHYMKPHEDGLRQLFDTIKETVPHQLHRVDEARKTFGKF